MKLQYSLKEKEVEISHSAKNFVPHPQSFGKNPSLTFCTWKLTIGDIK